MTGIWATYTSTWGQAQPTNNLHYGKPIYLCQRISNRLNGFVLGARYLRDPADTGEHIAFVRVPPSGAIQRICRFKRHALNTPPTPQWEHAYWRPRLPVANDQEFQITVYFQLGMYYYTPQAVLNAMLNPGDFTVPRHTAQAFNGMWDDTPQMNASQADNGARYGIDCLYFVPR